VSYISAVITRPLLLPVLLFALVGCAPRGAPAPSPPSRDKVTAAADQALTAYRLALADEAQTTADRAAGYKSWPEAYADWEQRNEAAQGQALKAWHDALNESLGFVPQADGSVKPPASYDGEKLSITARQSAAGFRERAR